MLFRGKHGKLPDEINFGSYRFKVIPMSHEAQIETHHCDDEHKNTKHCTKYKARCKQKFRVLKYLLRHLPLLFITELLICGSFVSLENMAKINLPRPYFACRGICIYFNVVIKATSTKSSTKDTDWPVKSLFLLPLLIFCFLCERCGFTFLEIWLNASPV